MINFKQGGLVVKAESTNSIRECLIGGGIVLAGITYLVKAAFRNGAQAYEVAKNQAVVEGTDGKEDK